MDEKTKLMHDKTMATLKIHEGFRNKVYKDTVGVLTVGWGHAFLEGAEYSDELCEAFFIEDYHHAVVTANYLMEEFGVTDLSMARRSIIINMAFNLGSRLVMFRKMWKALREKDYDEAANQMLDSKWYRQVHRRGTELVKCMKENRFPKGDYNV